MLDLASADVGAMVNDLEACGGLAVGSLTINGDAVKPVWDLLSSLVTLNLKGKAAAAFGSYGWSGEGPKLISRRLEDLKMKLVGDPVTCTLVPTEENLRAARELGGKLAAAMGV